MTAPYYVACFGGFLVVENYKIPYQDAPMQKVYTAPDPRVATTWQSFEQADATAKWAVNKLYPPDLRYFALFQVAVS